MNINVRGRERASIRVAKQVEIASTCLFWFFVVGERASRRRRPFACFFSFVCVVSGAPVFRRALRARVVDLGDVRLLEDVLPHLILLRLLEGLQVHPPDVVLALAAVHVRDRVQARDQQPVLGGPGHVVHHAVEQEGLPRAAAEGFRDEVVDAREVRAALDARVDVAAVEVVDERPGIIMVSENTVSGCTGNTMSDAADIRAQHV